MTLATFSRTLQSFLARGWVLALLGVGLAGAFIAIGWRDYVSARREFDTLVHAQAASIRDTVAAAARANRAAAQAAERALAERLLDNARLLAELDRRGSLTQTFLTEVAQRNQLFRITILAADATREQFIAPPGPGPGRGQGGPGWFAGAGLGPGSADMIDRLIREGEREAVTDLHAGRRADVARLAAGVRRAGGGAILLSVDATDVMNLQRQSSLDLLLDDIVKQTDAVAYLVFEQGSVRRAKGDLPAERQPTADDGGTRERELEVNGRPVLELTGPIDIGAAEPAHLHLAMRLDGLREAERRTLTRLAMTLTSATLLGFAALGLVLLHQRYGALSVQHARAQAALRRRDRLAAMGELASTVAHEIRNPLNAIAMSAQRLARECFDGDAPTSDADREEARALVRVVQGEAQRINVKVQQFLEYARPPQLDPRPTRLGPWLDQIAEAVRPLAAARDVSIDTPAAPDIEVNLDPEQMRQAVDNLLRNAIEASPAGSRVSLSAAVSGRELTITVADTGQGIAAEHLGKVFDLYFTTKADGTGVGLAVTHQIVSGHGGRIDVESAPDLGTTMRVVLPVMEG